MKKSIALILIALLLLPLLAACGQTGKTLPEGVQPMPPSIPGGPPVPPFLTTQQQDLYLRARYAMEAFQITIGWGSDGSGATVVVNGRTYVKANGEYTDYDTFYNDMRTLFTQDYLDNILLDNGYDPPVYIKYDGDLYYLPIPRTPNMYYTGPESFEAFVSTDTRIEFSLVAYYEDSTQNPAVYTVSRTIVMEKVDERWVFSTFALPY